MCKFLIHKDYKNSYIAQRSELSDDDVMKTWNGRLETCLSQDIKNAFFSGSQGFYGADRIAHRVKRFCPIKNALEEFEICDIESPHRALSASQFGVLSKSFYNDLDSVKTACYDDWCNAVNPDKIIWYNSSGHGL